MLKLLQQYEYKIIYKRMLYTCFILFIYILGTNISIVSYNDMQVKHESFFKIAISNMGGDVNTLNIFHFRIRSVVNINDYLDAYFLSEYG